MRLSTRTFLSIFVPIALLLVGSFWALRMSVMAAVREDLRRTVHENQAKLESERVRDQFQAARILAILAENPSLKAGLQLLLAERGDRNEARRTLEDQLADLVTSLNFDILAISGPDGHTLAGVRRAGKIVEPLDLETRNAGNAFQKGFFSGDGRMYQLSSGPIDQNDENLGQLTIGERVDLGRFGTPMVLTKNGHVVDSNVQDLDTAALQTALSHCSRDAECQVQGGGETYLSLPINSANSDGYLLRTLQNVDAASAPMNIAIWNVFVAAGFTALTATLLVSLVGSRSLARPIAQMVDRLKATEQTGELPEFETGDIRVQEIRELAKGFNRATSSVRGSREQLVRAYVEFTGSLANALDARDPYTAGHSRRVSEYACAIGRVLGFSDADLDKLRIGALLHDIGKIGISDSILLKPGKLTDEEDALIRQHPVIGRRILEGVQGFQDYLDVVELHHENWDGTGYPHGLKADETPLAAQIVKVADAFDAMTSDRPYRPGMSHEAAVRILERGVGTQFDASIVQAFASLPPGIRSLVSGSHFGSLQKLAAAIAETAASSPVMEDA